MCPAFELCYVTENFDWEIRNNFNCVINVLKENLVLDLIPTKYREILVGKCLERTVFSKI